MSQVPYDDPSFPYGLVCAECEEWATHYNAAGQPICANHQED